MDELDLMPDHLIDPELVKSGLTKDFHITDMGAQQALEKVKGPLTSGPVAVVTPAQSRIEAVADLTKTALARAATLQLTKEESDSLTADFPDECFQPGAAGKENLIYIEHAALRDRFNSVLGLGQWAIIVRETWNENFMFQPSNKNPKGVEAVKVYCRAMLLVRGCYVGEAVGDMDYIPKNNSQNYGDAFEGAKTAAFRRCAKEFGIGLQAWKKDWCAGWWQRRNKPGQPAQRAAHAPAPPAPPAQTASTCRGTAKPADVLPPKEATEQTRKWMIEQLKGIEEEAYHYAVDQGWILPEVEGLADIPLNRVPTTKEAMLQLIKNIRQWANPEATAAAHDPNEDEAWRTFPMPFGKHAGVKLGDLEKPYLFGLWANYTVETEYNGRPKKPETIAKDREFRHMLDMAGQHYQFEKKD